MPLTVLSELELFLNKQPKAAPDTLALTLYVRPTLLSHTEPMKGRKFENILTDKKAFSLGGRPFLAASVTLDPDTIRLLRSLTHRVRLTLLSHTAPTKSRSSHKQKRPQCRPVRVLRPRQKAAKGGKGEGEGKEVPRRKTVGRGKGGKCRLLYQFCLFPSLPSPEGVPLWASPSVTLAAEGCALHVGACSARLLTG